MAKTPKIEVENTVTVQATAKTWKGMLVADVAIAILGGIFAIYGGQVASGIGPFIGLAGIGLILIARFASWWYHG